jgi:hypothetical protein
MWRANRTALLNLIADACRLDLGPNRELLLERFFIAREDANAGEEVHAFEVLCENLYEFSVPIPRSFLDSVRAVGDSFSVPRDHYAAIDDLLPKMWNVFVIEDERHADPQGEFASFDEALAELHRRASVPWDQKPNVAPCLSWKTCGRSYEIIEYDPSRVPWQVVRRVPVLEVTAEGIEWESEFEAE